MEHVDWASLETARGRKERRHPELSGQFGRARHLAQGKLVGNLSRSSVEPRLPSSCDGVFSWFRSAAKAFAPSLLEARSCVSSDGCIPLTGEVMGDAWWQARKWQVGLVGSYFMKRKGVQSRFSRKLRLRFPESNEHSPEGQLELGGEEGRGRGKDLSKGCKFCCQRLCGVNARPLEHWISKNFQCNL